jgi:sec-independent protein translocase protein TatB
MPDILFILLLALIIFGPKRLPEIARQFGKLMFQFRQMSCDLRAQLEREMLKIEMEEHEKKIQQSQSMVSLPDEATPTNELVKSSS